MGRHTAADGTSVHPLVAEGLSRRAVGTGTHRTDARQSTEVGWPAPATKGEGLGWPGDLATDGDDGEAAAEEPAPRARRGWRRSRGADPAA
jgi:hypothetical protein